MTPDHAATPPDEPTDPVQEPVIVIGPGAMAVSESAERPTDLVGQPAKVMRIGSMVKQLLEEVRSAPLDEAGRNRLAQIHERSLQELEQGLAPELVEELRRISLPFGEDGTPTESELRIAQAQLVGWLEGLFHGIQTALLAQQMSGGSPQRRPALPGPSSEEGAGNEAGPGQYL